MKYRFKKRKKKGFAFFFAPSPFRITSSCPLEPARREATGACSLSFSFPFTFTFTYSVPCFLISLSLFSFSSLSLSPSATRWISPLRPPSPPQPLLLSLHLRSALTFHPLSAGCSLSIFFFFLPLTPSALLANYCQFSSLFFFQLPLPLCPFSLTLPPYFHLSLLSPRPPPSGSL